MSTHCYYFNNNYNNKGYNVVNLTKISSKDRIQPEYSIYDENLTNESKKTNTASARAGGPDLLAFASMKIGWEPLIYRHLAKP